MTAKAITRLALYGLAIVIGGVVAVVAQVQGDELARNTALGWIVTNVLAGLNINRGSEDAEHAAD